MYFLFLFNLSKLSLVTQINLFSYIINKVFVNMVLQYTKKFQKLEF